MAFVVNQAQFKADYETHDAGVLVMDRRETCHRRLPYLRHYPDYQQTRVAGRHARYAGRWRAEVTDSPGMPVGL